MTFGMESGHLNQQSAHNFLMELLKLLRTQKRLQGSLALQLLHVGLEVLLQGGQRLLSVFNFATAESSRALKVQNRDLHVLQELDCLSNSTSVASEVFSATKDLLLEMRCRHI